MTLFEAWEQYAKESRTQSDNDTFWQEYFDKETKNYKRILSDTSITHAGTFKELADTFEMDSREFIGFLDGINTSLKSELAINDIDEDTTITLDIDFEKLFFNMHEAKADWLYSLSEWDGVLSKERRDEITLEYKRSKTYVSDTVIGRNDPCPCGSGKKYKKCCGATN